MGSNPRSSVFYGFSLGEDVPNLEELLCEKLGISGESYKARERAFKETGITEVLDGDLSSGNTRSYLAIADSEQSTSWDDPLKIDFNKFKVGADWDEKLKKFCELCDLEYRTPEFLMVASYG